MVHAFKLKLFVLNRRYRFPPNFYPYIVHSGCDANFQLPSLSSSAGKTTQISNVL